MDIKHIKIEEIRPYKDNAKKHDKKQVTQVANSIKRFGWAQPLVVDKNNELIIGHCRLEAAKLLGLTEVPILKLENLSPQEVKALRLADNKLNESAWDMKLVIPDLKGLDSELLDLTGFDKDLIIEPSELDDVIPENVPARSKLGDLYELGQHRVLCGDSTQPEAVSRLMDGKKADMVFTDPPYGMKLNADYSGMKGWHQGKKYDNVIGDHADFNNDFINNIFSIFKDTKEKFLFGYVDVIVQRYVDYVDNPIVKCNGEIILWNKTEKIR